MSRLTGDTQGFCFIFMTTEIECKGNRDRDDILLGILLRNLHK